MKTGDQRQTNGFTLVEIAMGLALVSILSLAISSSIAASVSVAAEVSAQVEVDNQLRRTVQQLVTELRHVDLDTVEVATDGSSLIFHSVKGWEDGSNKLGEEKYMERGDEGLYLDGRLIAGDVEGLLFELEGDDLFVTVSKTTIVFQGGEKRAISRRVRAVVNQ